MTTLALKLSNIRHSPPFNAGLDFAGRIALAAIFLLSGISKIQFFEGNAQYMASVGISEVFLPAAIAFEILAALFIIVGYQVRITAIAIAGFSLVTALLFHNNLADQMQFIMFFKNIAIAGGFLVLAANGAGKISLDARR